MSASKRRFPLIATVILLVVVAIFCFMPTTVQAETVTQYGITVDLTTDKTDYVSGDTVNIKVQVTNTNQMNMEDVSLALTLPEGLVLQSGATSISTGALASGEMKEFSLVATVPGAVSQSATARHTSPQTGDDSPLALLSILALAAVGLLVLAIRYRKKLKGLFSFLLCLTLLGSTFAFVPVEVKAAVADSSSTFDDVLNSTVDGRNALADIYYLQIRENAFKMSSSPPGVASHSTRINGVDEAFTADKWYITTEASYLVVDPTSLDIRVGETANASYMFLDSNHKEIKKVPVSNLKVEVWGDNVRVDQASSSTDALITGLKETPDNSPVTVAASFNATTGGGDRGIALFAFLNVTVRADIPLGGISFAKPKYYAYIDELIAHPVADTTGDAINQKPYYAVSNESFVMIDEHGNMTGRQEGEVTLTASVTGTYGATYIATTLVEVVILGGIEVPSDRVYLNKSTGEVVALTATAWGSFEGKEITWTSSDPAIVVDANGNAHATVDANVAATYSISAKATNDNGDTATGTFRINIIETQP
ncbi:DUF11 domain-containing protein [Ruminococcaceae bacterium OttesenSCG-928-I18]|nr:DUF11 domain-containing protein [Ruminococcaceae bacterium OttesenSCG-928-I18]